jgi:putative flippase GtrA
VFSRYLLIGVAATFAHWLLLAVLVELVVLPALLATGLGALVGAQVAFAGNRRFTFGHRGSSGPAWFKFMGAAALGGWGCPKFCV